MGDMREVFDALKEHDRARKKRNLESANADGWTKHTPYHWSRELNGHRLDYWPSTTRFRYRGKVMVGGVDGFIKNREANDE